MKKVLYLLVLAILLNLFSFTVSAENLSNTVNASNNIVLPDLGVEIPKVSSDSLERIGEISDEILTLTSNYDESSMLNMSDSERQTLMRTTQDSYQTMKEELLSLGALKLTGKQELMYAYGLGEEKIDDLCNINQTSRASAAIPGINYPEIEGIDFYIFEYSYSTSSTSYDMAQCIALPTEDVESKMVRDSGNVDMYSLTSISTLAEKLVQLSAEEISNYALSEAIGGVWTFAIGALWDLTGDVLPAKTSSLKASNQVRVTTSSRVVHYWVKTNGTYYFRLATCAAVISESWLMIDVNGKHYYKYNEFWAYSNYHRDGANARAASINNYESYSINIPYKVENKVLGITYWVQKLEAVPFHAALPIQFAS